mgnify:CR=1 FL=1
MDRLRLGNPGLALQWSDDETLAKLRGGGRILFRYANRPGDLTADANPNGSMDSIAGIANADFNVMGMMPHPERACEKILGSADGRGVFSSLIAAAVERA